MAHGTWPLTSMRKVDGIGVFEGATCVTPKTRDQASRAISTARLNDLRRLHLPPINVVVSHGPSGVLRPRSIHLGTGFPLRCFQRLSLPDFANRRCHWRDNRDTSGLSNPVLSY